MQFWSFLSWSSKGGCLGFTHNLSDSPITIELGEVWTQWASFQMEREWLRSLRLLGSLIIVSKLFPFWPFPISYCSRTFSWNIRTERCNSTLSLGKCHGCFSSTVWDTFTNAAHVNEQMRGDLGRSSSWTSRELWVQELLEDAGEELGHGQWLWAHRVIS